MNDQIPQPIVVTGRPHGTPPVCIGCHRPIDTTEDYWVLLDDAPGRRPALLAAAHSARWDDDQDDYDDRCAGALRSDWEHALAGSSARALRLGADRGGPRFFAGRDPLHAGTPLEVLTAEGVWLAGHFEYDTRRNPWQALVYIRLAGWGQPDARLLLAQGTIVRITDR
jgi:hypothetical protein